MLLAHEWFCILESIVAFILVFSNLSKYKGEKVSWGLFIFVLVNLGLHLSTFVVLPFDLMKVDTVNLRRRTIWEKRVSTSSCCTGDSTIGSALSSARTPL